LTGVAFASTLQCLSLAASHLAFVLAGAAGVAVAAGAAALAAGAGVAAGAAVLAGSVAKAAVAIRVAIRVAIVFILSSFKVNEMYAGHYCQSSYMDQYVFHHNWIVSNHN
jgi:hypothetical protein